MSGNSVWAWVFAAVAVVGSLLYYYANHASEQRLRATGMPARARILSMRQTGTLVNYQPQVELEVEAGADGAAPSRLTLRVVVPQAHVAAVQPGQVIRIRIDPDRPTRAVVDEAWAR